MSDDLVAALAAETVAVLTTSGKEPTPLGNDKGPVYAALSRAAAILDEAVISGALGAEERRIVSLYGRGYDPAPCRVFWGTHGCDLARGHDGPCLCGTCWDPLDTEGYVGAWPYYGPETRFYGEDAEAKWGIDRLVSES